MSNKFISGVINYVVYDYGCDKLLSDMSRMQERQMWTSWIKARENSEISTVQLDGWCVLELSHRNRTCKRFNKLVPSTRVICIQHSDDAGASPNPDNCQLARHRCEACLDFETRGDSSGANPDVGGTNGLEYRSG